MGRGSQHFLNGMIAAAAFSAISTLADVADADAPAWAGYAGNAQHTALAPAAADPLQTIRWSTPVDDDLPGGELYIHYGSPAITAANTVIVPVRNSAGTGFNVTAINGSTGAAIWTQSSNYIMPPHNWVPSFSPVVSPQGTLYYPAANGAINYVTNPDQSGATVSGSYSFYTGTPSSNIVINTPLTSDSSGDIYFGFEATGTNPLNLAQGAGGIARIDPSGNATWTSVYTAAGNDSSVSKVALNSAPAVSDGKLYVAVNNSTGSDFNNPGELLELNSTTLAPMNKVVLNAVYPPGTAANVPDDGTASPTIGPDGDVYFGVLNGTSNGTYYNNDRGYLLHFTSDLKTTRDGSTPLPNGAFGWDDTVSIVPSSMLGSLYTGTSQYLIMTKYNNYANTGGDGENKVAILDPNATEIDPVTGETVMKEVITALGPTPNPPLAGVREWCINSAVVDPATDSVLVNNEDGHLYRWVLDTNTLSESIDLTNGIGEAYTPTLVGPDGAVYAINDGVLFSVVPEPASMTMVMVGGAMLLVRRRSRR
jgi:hypothetical protein